MAYYYSLRGWLECDSEEFTIVVKVLDEMIVECRLEEQSSLYLKGWCWSPHSVNWLRYIFYGASVQDEGLKLLETAVRRMIAAAPEVEGQFEGVGEDEEKRWIIKVSDRKIIINSDPEKTSDLMP